MDARYSVVHTRQHLILCVNLTDSGIHVRRWVSRLRSIHEIGKREKGPAFVNPSSESQSTTGGWNEWLVYRNPLWNFWGSSGLIFSGHSYARGSLWKVPCVQVFQAWIGIQSCCKGSQRRRQVSNIQMEKKGECYDLQNVSAHWPVVRRRHSGQGGLPPVHESHVTEVGSIQYRFNRGVVDAWLRVWRFFRKTSLFEPATKGSRVFNLLWGVIKLKVAPSWRESTGGGLRLDCYLSFRIDDCKWRSSQNSRLVHFLQPHQKVRNCKVTVTRRVLE